jgi:hypothetical protein
MSLINRLHLTGRFEFIPGRVTVELFRINALDVVVANQIVPEAEVRSPSRKDTPGREQPNKTKSRVFHLWVDHMSGWQLREFDKILFEGEWWNVDDVSLEMMNTRYRATCTQSSDPR